MRGSEHIQALFSEEKNVGKLLKASKTKHTWQFTLYSVPHTVELFTSVISGKRRVVLDGAVIFTGKAMDGMFFKFHSVVDGEDMMVEQTERGWELWIDGVAFRQLTYAGSRKTTRGDARKERREEKDRGNDISRYFTANAPSKGFSQTTSSVPQTGFRPCQLETELPAAPSYPKNNPFQPRGLLYPQYASASHYAPTQHPEPPDKRYLSRVTSDSRISLNSKPTRFTETGFLGEYPSRNPFK